MGQEFGQFLEWKYDWQLEWAVSDEMNDQMQAFTTALAHFYQASPQLFELDHDYAGFEVIDADNTAESVLSFIRKDASGNQLICVFNMAPIERSNFTIGVPFAGTYTEVLNSEMAEFGGSWLAHNADTATQKGQWKDYQHTLSFTLPALGAVIWKLSKDDGEAQTKKKKSVKKSAKKSIKSSPQTTADDIHQLTDAEWDLLAEYFPMGSRAKYEKRDLVNAALYIQQTGTVWAKLPAIYPPYGTVYAFYKRTLKNGNWQKVLDVLDKKI
jgi:1,4-alpha-glucan branching enzyme